MLARISTALFLVFAILGLVFASLSTSDFVQHLDRQVHALHCSFVPGAAPSTDAESGCHVALMSTWSSVFRSFVWGGFPVALPGVAIFAFMAFRGAEMFVRGFRDRTAAMFLFAVSLIPVLTSVFFFLVAVTQLGEICKTCAGIYTASLLSMLAAAGIVMGAWWEGGEPDTDEADEDAPKKPAAKPEHPAIVVAVGLAELGVFVAAPFLLYLALVPDHGKYVGTCGTLADSSDPNEVLVSIGQRKGGKPSIEVFDPLCPACKGFEARLEKSGLGDQLDRKALLFPLDSTCNWMVGSSLHPGACVVSEGILCAEGRAQEVVDWAFAHQDEIRTATTADPAAAERMLDAAFPTLAKCTGSAKAKQQLNRSLRWAVNNQLPVLTPQLYVEGRKLCDEDTDLGLDFALSRMLAN